MDFLTTVSLITGIVSIVLAIIAMITAKIFEKGSQENFEKTQRIMQDIYDKTKDALAQIDKKAAVIENVVQRNQEQLMNTMTNLLNETIIPKKPDIGEQLGVQFLQTLMQNPDGMADNINKLMKLSAAIDNKK
jgi:predicted PurR-regulated permease PerM